MYIVQGINTEYRNVNKTIFFYAILDTRDGITEFVNRDLLSEDDIVFGECLYCRYILEYAKLFYTRKYKLIGLDYEMSYSYVKRLTSKAWNILKVIDGVVIDNSFSVNIIDSCTIGIKKASEVGSTKISVSCGKSTSFVTARIRIDIDDSVFYANKFSNISNIRVGLCEIQKISDNNYNLYMCAISDSSNEVTGDFYIRLDMENEIIYFDGFKDDYVYLNTVKNLKRKLGGVISCQ